MCWAGTWAMLHGYYFFVKEIVVLNLLLSVLMFTMYTHCNVIISLQVSHCTGLIFLVSHFYVILSVSYARFSAFYE